MQVNPPRSKCSRCLDATRQHSPPRTAQQLPHQPVHEEWQRRDNGEIIQVRLPGQPSPVSLPPSSGEPSPHNNMGAAAAGGAGWVASAGGGGGPSGGGEEVRRKKKKKDRQPSGGSRTQPHPHQQVVVEEGETGIGGALMSLWSMITDAVEPLTPQPQAPSSAAQPRAATVNGGGGSSRRSTPPPSLPPSPAPSPSPPPLLEVNGGGGRCASPEAPPSEAGSIEVSINTTTTTSTATAALLPGTLDLLAARKAVAAQKAAGRWSSSCAKERESSEPRTWTQALYDDLVGGR